MKAGECVFSGSLQAMNAVNPLNVLEEFFMTPSFTHWNDFFSWSSYFSKSQTIFWYQSDTFFFLTLLKVGFLRKVSLISISDFLRESDRNQYTNCFFQKIGKYQYRVYNFASFNHGSDRSFLIFCKRTRFGFFFFSPISTLHFPFCRKMYIPLAIQP